VRLSTGVRIDIKDLKKANAIAPALIKAGYKIPKTEAGNNSIDKVFLEKCGEVGEHLHRAREWANLSTTFVKQIREHAIETNGEWRIHSTTNQIKSTDQDGSGKGVRYGRTSMTDPGLQQQPVRSDDYGEMWRSIFMADRDARWACCDWSQQEPRIVIDACEKHGLPGAKEFADEYRKNPALDIHQYFADITGIARKIVKNYVNGRLYGMGDLKTCRHIKQPVERKMVRGELKEVPGPAGQAIIDKFNEYAPWIQGFTRAAAQAVKRNGGHIWTKLRRKCHFNKKPGGRDNEWEDEHKAGNRYGQGTAADQAKATLVAADAEGIPVQLLIHDEFDLSFSAIKQPKRMKELMLTVVKFGVPMKVDLEIGESWGTMEKVED
jgi:DNA polymerase I-like protein with 3'-5' exonuclease and polymerase domains